MGPCWMSLGYGENILAHCGRDKMAAISQTIFSDAFSLMKKIVLIKISLKFVPKVCGDGTSHSYL